MPTEPAAADGALKRELGVGPAMMMGLGSILGTGIFVSVGIAAGVAGPSVLLAVLIAAAVATCNALSSAQLAASHSVSGGTYEYGYRYLTPSLGFSAGWLFLLAKSASAATAALGFAGYIRALLGLEALAATLLASATVVVLTLVVLAGIRRSSHVNIAIVSITVAALCLFVGAGVWKLVTSGPGIGLTPFLRGDGTGEGLANLFHATALMFVAYTGYGRIATMAEEVRDPRHSIPRAVIATLAVSALLYAAVAFVGVTVVGADFMAESAEKGSAPLSLAAREFGIAAIPALVALGAVTAMLGVLLNLILGLSRVLLAMGRRNDMPSLFARLDNTGTTPWAAVVGVGVLILALTLIGNVKTTWSFSAFTVLVYYAITNLAALSIAPRDRLYPRWIPVLGLAMCLFLAFHVAPAVWLTGLCLLAAGLLWRAVFRRLRAV